MTTYDTLKKIIPPDQALANQALSRSLRQVKDIFKTDLPALSAAVSTLESNKDLPLINALTTPIPPAIANVWKNNLAVGTGPGNTLTTNDFIGTASGNTHNTQLPIVTNVLTDLNSLGALNVLTYDDGNPNSANVLGIYTVMNYTLGNSYTTDDMMGNVTISIPAPQPGQGIYGPFGNFTLVASNCFANLISLANAAIITIANTYSDLAAQSNQATSAMAEQLAYNSQNCVAAGIDIGNVVAGNFVAANLVANSTSTALGLTTRLHEIGRDVTEGGQAQFFEATANLTNITGQGVISAMREGRNIAVLNAVGINLDTQIPDITANVVIANNLSDAQYSAAQAQANIVI